MTNRQQIEAEMRTKILEGESKIERLKAKMHEADEDARKEIREAIDAAQRGLDKGKAKLDRLAKATDDQFDEIWADTKEAWHGVKHELEHGWNQLSDKVKTFLA